MHWLLPFLLLFASAAYAALPRVDLKLIPERGEIRQGDSVLVGVRMQIEPGWHIYWKYPGDAGLATKVTWSAPEGFTISDLLWPVPRRFVQPGEIEGFGYEGEVMLLARLSSPKNYRGDAKIQAKVTWLACKEVCVPGRGSIDGSIRIGDQQSPADPQVARWMARVPKDADQQSVQRDNLTYRLQLPHADTQSAEVFIVPAEGLALQDVQKSPQSITVRMRRLGNMPSRGSSEAVVSIGDKLLRFVLPAD